jgi:hypothetical protein
MPAYPADAINDAALKATRRRWPPACPVLARTPFASRDENAGAGRGHGTGDEVAERGAIAWGGYRPMPILFNEDDHFDFAKPSHRMLEALASYASWGYFEGGRGDN